jgi:hypothetical protein
MVVPASLLRARGCSCSFLLSTRRRFGYPIQRGMQCAAYGSGHELLVINQRRSAMSAGQVPAKFSLGQVVATPGALAALQATGERPLLFLQRHVQGDWGELDPEDVGGTSSHSSTICRETNKRALAQRSCNAPVADTWHLIGVRNNKSLHGSCARASSRVSCQPQ